MLPSSFETWRTTAFLFQILTGKYAQIFSVFISRPVALSAPAQVTVPQKSILTLVTSPAVKGIKQWAAAFQNTIVSSLSKTSLAVLKCM
jgi:hypothetical protein